MARLLADGARRANAYGAAKAGQGEGGQFPDRARRRGYPGCLSRGNLRGWQAPVA